MTNEAVIKEYLAALSSKAPVPGGGGASALAAAFGTCLGQMVANLTVGKKKYAAVDGQMRCLLGEMETLKEAFLILADRDEEVFAPLAKCYSLPVGTPEERAYKETQMEKHLLAATLVPLELMERAAQMLDILEYLAANGSRLAVSDVGVGVQFIRTGLTGAIMNVYINTRSMKNRGKAQELNEKAAKLLTEGIARADAVYEDVLKVLRS